MSAGSFRAALVAFSTVIVPAAAQAEPPATTVQYQVMVSAGLAARKPFEAWFVFDKSSDPRVPGYSIPAGATIRFVFPKSFTPKPGGVLGAVMLKGWSQGAISTKFITALDPTNPRVVAIHFAAPIAPGSVENPGLKAIHLRTNEINPTTAGSYPITIQFVDAGPLSGKTTAIAHITKKPVPNIAAYNQLHPGKDEDWQHVRAGHAARLPIDFLATLPNECRSSFSLKSTSDRTLNILSDGKPIGSISANGVPVVLTPQPFGPGFARLGVVEVHAKAGSTAGMAKITAALNGGTHYTIHLIVEDR
jgi:hypothetical protein